MRLARALLLAAAALLSSVVQSADDKPQVDGWYECTAVTFAEQLPSDPSDAASLNGAAQCATFKAPLCHTGVCKDTTNKQIDVFVKRIKSSVGGASAPNIFFLQGGPGSASPAMESAMTGIYSLLKGNVNVYTMDHRGTGRSTKLDCVAAQAQTSASPGGTSIDSSEVGTCADEIASKYGSDLSSFSVTSAASDLQLFITSFLTNQKTFIYGVSYGTSLVERLMHLNVTGIHGYILDGISTTSGSDPQNFEDFSKWDTDFNEVAQFFLTFCSKNQDDCGKYFKDASVSDTLLKLTKALDSGAAKCTTALDKLFSKLFEYAPGDFSPGTILRQVLGSLMSSAETRSFIPVLTYRMTRCSSDDMNVLNHFATMLTETLTDKTESEQYSSDLLYKLIVYSEFWETPTPSFKEMSARYLNTTISSGTASASAVETYCVFTKEKSAACTPYADFTQYKASPLVYKKDKYWNVAASPPKGASVLLMSSKMDPQTPHKYAELLLAALNTDNKKLVAFEAATHGTLWSTKIPGSTPCGSKIVASYLASGGDLTKTDTTCVAKVPPASFKIDPDLVAQWLNASSPYDGAFTGSVKVDLQGDGKKSSSSSDTASGASDGTSYLAVFIVFLVLFVVAAAASVVFLIKWRHAKKQTKDLQSYEATDASPHA